MMHKLDNETPRLFIVNTPLVKVIQEESCFRMVITCKDGSVVEHEPFQPNLEGMVAAISLSAEICAGKFYLSKVVSVPKELATIDFNAKKRGG